MANFSEMTREQLINRIHGSGIPRDRPGAGMGLRIMKYRAAVAGGSLAIQRDSHGGTIVTCAIRPAATAMEDAR
jgi:nitrate/nitrite-specific signal transduction histidine kinase